jgi:DNA-binding SARP family transcriptional activator/tetratricopeptide (TPR) repeat protein
MNALLSPLEQPASTLPSLRFYLLGSPIVVWHDTILAISRRAVRALLYRLACEANSVSREHLHLLFWPDWPELAARRNLSHNLTHLRRALPEPGVLGADHDRVWLAAERVWCDALELKHARIDSSLEHSTLRDLVSYYRGAFLGDFDLPGCPEFEHWCIVERVALERKYLVVLGRLVERCTSQGEIHQAILYARRYLETDGLSEVMHQRLIQLYAASGERHLALQQFDQCASVLGRELSVEPLPETLAIYQAVKIGQLRFPEPPAPLQAPVLPEGDAPLIGREDELCLLEDIFRQPHSGTGQAVLIYGEAGIGKTRLLHEFARRHEAEAQVLYGCGHEGDQTIPYHPLQEIIRAILGLPELAGGGDNPTLHSQRTYPDFIEPVWLTEISRLFPELHLLYPDLPAPLALEPKSAQTRLFDALCRLILSYPKACGPVLLCLDDLQWMDAGTLAWVAQIGRYLKKGSHPLLILATCRSEENERILELRHALVQSKILTELRLARLDEGAVLRLARALIGCRSGDEILAHQLHQATGGNPFYVIEIIRKLIEDGRLEQDFREMQKFTPPESVREAVQARLELVSPIARQVLEAGAVLGRSFSLDLLRLTAGRSFSETVTAVEELVARILLVETQQEFRFIHELTRQHVAESLGQVRKQLLHLRAGRATLRLNSGAFPSLAYHYEQGGDLSRALEYQALAGEKAQAIFAWEEVEFHYGRMLDLMARIDPAGRQPDLVARRGAVLAGRAYTFNLLGRQAERDADLQALDDLGEISNDDRIRLQAIFSRLRYLNLDGEYIQAISLGEKGLALLKSSPAFSTDPEQVRLAQSRLLAQIGFGYYFLGKPEEALDVLEQAKSICREKKDSVACGSVLHTLGYVYLHLGEYARALECQQQSLACHQAVGDTDRMAWDLMDLGAVHKNLSDPATARQHLEQGLELASRVSSQQAEAYGLANLGSLNLNQGDYTAGAVYFNLALELQQAAPSEHILAMAEAGLGFAHYHLGDYAHSRPWLESALLRTRTASHRRHTAEILIQMGVLDIAENCLPQARWHLIEGLSLAQACQSGDCLAAGSAALARLERLAGDPACALEIAIDAIRAARKAGSAGCEMWGEIEAGLACLALGDLPSALEHTQGAVSLAPRASQEWIQPEEAQRAQALVLQALHPA